MRGFQCTLRPMVDEDVVAYARSLKRSFNAWYWDHGWGHDYFQCDDRELAVFWDIYREISHGHCVVAEDPHSGDLIGACFYHPRERHVTLGIMSVDPDYFGRGVGKQLVAHIVDFTERHGYPALRVASSAINMNSFSLYTKAGFVPKVTYQDMAIPVPRTGLEPPAAQSVGVRDASLNDVKAIKSLELEISGICREADYRYCIENPLGCLHASVIDGNPDGVAGFAASIKHPALNMVGPAFCRTQAEMLALVLRELDRFRGESALVLIPMDMRELVEPLYRLGGVNVETHLFQVRGEFQPFRGISLPSFLPETG